MAKKHTLRTKLPHAILAEGEATGHAHRVQGQNVALWETDDPDILILDIPAGAEAIVTHEEHNQQVILPGQYERRIVREYDHFAEETRQVRD